MARRQKRVNKARQRQRQMLVAVQILLMLGILFFVIFFRDHFSIVTSSLVSSFESQDIQIQEKEKAPPKEAPKNNIKEKPNKLE